MESRLKGEPYPYPYLQNQISHETRRSIKLKISNHHHLLMESRLRRVESRRSHSQPLLLFLIVLSYSYVPTCHQLLLIQKETEDDCFDFVLKMIFLLCQSEGFISNQSDKRQKDGGYFLTQSHFHLSVVTKLVKLTYLTHILNLVGRHQIFPKYQDTYGDDNLVLLCSTVLSFYRRIYHP